MKKLFSNPLTYFLLAVLIVFVWGVWEAIVILLALKQDVDNGITAELSLGKQITTAASGAINRVTTTILAPAVWLQQKLGIGAPPGAALPAPVDPSLQTASPSSDDDFTAPDPYYSGDGAVTTN